MVRWDSTIRKVIVYVGYSSAIAFGLLFAYAAIYLLLLDGKLCWPAGRDPVTGLNKFRIEPRFYLAGRFVTVVMAPAHACDRQIRSEYWSTVEFPSGRTLKVPTP